jgi:hypothetical protein
VHDSTSRIPPRFRRSSTTRTSGGDESTCSSTTPIAFAARGRLATGNSTFHGGMRGFHHLRSPSLSTGAPQSDAAVSFNSATSTHARTELPRSNCTSARHAEGCLRKRPLARSRDQLARPETRE